MAERGWDAVGSDGAYEYATAALSVFWPEAEHAKLLARWPHSADEVGATWDEHRRRVERHCARIERLGASVEQLPGNVEEVDAFLTTRGSTDPSHDDLMAYPDLRTVTTPMRPWPPDRTAPCWCGSGRTYKRCCRPHGLGSLDDAGEA